MIATREMRRAQIWLKYQEGIPITRIARDLGVCRNTVWRDITAIKAATQNENAPKRMERAAGASLPHSTTDGDSVPVPDAVGNGSKEESHS